MKKVVFILGFISMSFLSANNDIKSDIKKEEINQLADNKELTKKEKRNSNLQNEVEKLKKILLAEQEKTNKT